MPDQKHTIIYCRCSDINTIPDSTRKEIQEGLNNANLQYTAIDDLCGATTEELPIIQELSNYEQVTIIACYPRAIKWLLHKAGITINEKKFNLLNMRKTSPADIIRNVSQYPTGKPSEDINNKNNDWLPWFPIIDYDRCTHCKQCHSFCLFGVYEITEDNKVLVTNPANCKTHCPACARICPNAAIIFPKITESPINGNEISDEDSTKAQIQINVDEILGGDVYQALASRRAQSKKRLLKKKASEQAEQERVACSVNCKKECQMKDTQK